MDMLYGDKPMAFWSNLHHHQLHSMEAPKPYEDRGSESQDTTEKHSSVIVSVGRLCCLSWFHSCVQFFSDVALDE